MSLVLLSFGLSCAWTALILWRLQTLKRKEHSGNRMHT